MAYNCNVNAGFEPFSFIIHKPQIDGNVDDCMGKGYFKTGELIYRSSMASLCMTNRLNRS